LALHKDRSGRVWVSTVKGLCLYNDRGGFERISSADGPLYLTNILETSDGKLFYQSVNAIYRYDPSVNRIGHALVGFNPSKSSFITSYLDSQDRMWVVGLNSITCHDTRDYNMVDSIGSQIHSYHGCMMGNGELWMSGVGRLSIYNTKTFSFIPVPKEISTHPVLSRADIFSIFEYDKDKILFTTSHNGIYMYDRKAHKVYSQFEEGFPFTAPTFKVSCIFKDSQQNVWFGSFDQGYYVSYKYKDQFNSNNYLTVLMKGKSVVAIAHDSRDNIWMSTLKDGLFVYEKQNRKVVSVDFIKLFPDFPPGEMSANPFFIDKEDNLWLGFMQQNVLFKCRYVKGKLSLLRRFFVPVPMSICQDENGTIWIGTTSNNIYYINPGDKSPSALQIHDPGFTFTPALLPLGDGRMMVSSLFHNLKSVDVNTKKFKDIEISYSDKKACLHRSVMIPTAIVRNGNDIYLGTVGNGLLCYSLDTRRLKPISGTPCLDISSLEIDHNGKLWVGTMDGLGKYDIVKETCTNYFEADGIGGNQFYDRSSDILGDGTLVFGGTHGITIFSPRESYGKRKVPFVFENLKVHNKIVEPGKGGCIDRELAYNPNIVLTQKQNGFSISFAALDYCENERTHYFYKMEGFDRYWIDADCNNEAYYANLPAGKYRFRVRITNNNKSIEESEHYLDIRVKPYPWLTWWARSCYFLLAASIFFFLYNMRKKIIAERHEKKKAEMEKAQEEKVNKMNMSFFSNVAHEFRTPLTVISGPVEQLSRSCSISESDKNLLSIVQRSVARMLRLVNQMMDFNRLENDTLKLKVRQMDVISKLKEIIGIFKYSAGIRGLELSGFGLEDTFTLWLDDDKLDKIICNLLSNAQKFTPSGGKISLSFDVISRGQAEKMFSLTETDVSSQYVKIVVADTGKGIPSDQLEMVFDRYYQLNNQTKGAYNYGTGIGLYYARSLARLHHGFLKAGNRPVGGAEFTLILPVDGVAYSDDEKRPLADDEKSFAPVESVPELVKTVDHDHSEEVLPSIMVVDDDPEVSGYLDTLLSSKYKVTCCFDAEGAMRKMHDDIPDIVLSDVIMPGKSGFELCKEIKSDLQLSHIPVILITAKVTVHDQVEGLGMGADAYVTKPFDPAYLLALIKSQLKNRERIKALLNKSTQTDDMEDDTLTPQDRAFMTKLYHLMDEKLSDSELDILKMTEFLGISRTKFYYKVKGLTGENPSIFFKHFKLNRAASLLKEGVYNISEIADMTGFSTLSHFSTSFKKQFGVPPSDYK
ncbi:MAG: response regulator, partial [Bacteroidales bacterium]|nr:response regulator [Bacteroidales bacterium]